MLTHEILEQVLKADPSWGEAQTIARTRLRMPTTVPWLIRQGWTHQSDGKLFLKQLSVSRLSLRCLIDAAEFNTSKGVNAEMLREALQFLGLRYCSVVLVINHLCKLVLDNTPPPFWQEMFREMMTNVEIGYRFGSHVPAIGIEGGALIGAASFAGMVPLLLEDQKKFANWYRKNKRQAQGESIKDLFGCDLYQVSAATLQTYGFGAEVAIGAGLGTGKIDTRLLNLDPSVLGWKAAYLWIEALRDGRNYPAAQDMRNAFSQLRPPAGQGERNHILETLHAEVSSIRSKGSSWTWHLPKEHAAQTAHAKQESDSQFESA